MRVAVGLVLLGLVLAGCTGTQQGNNTSNPYGNSTGGTTPPAPPPSPPAGNGTGSGTLTWTNAQNPVIVWDTTRGTIKAEMFLDKAPITAGNFVNLTRSGFYDGTRFHRVIPDFMIQDGDPLSKDTAQKARWGTGGSGTPIKDEFPCKDGTTSYAHQRSTGVRPCTSNGGLLFTHDGAGILSMANSGPNSGSSQYFITVAKTDWLDGQHPIFGRVIEGLDVAIAISKVPNSGPPNNRPNEDVVIRSMKVEGA